MGSKTRSGWVIGLAIVLTLCLAGLVGAVVKNGMIGVSVHEEREDGVHLSLYLPGFLAAIAVNLVPDQICDEFYAEIENEFASFDGIARAACRELIDSEDCTLVEVESANETVRIDKQHGRLVIHVDTDSEEVRLQVPLGLVSSVLDRLEQRATDI